MKKIIVIICIFVFLNKLSAFNPLEGNFVDSNKYELFRSWIEFGRFPADNPAFISKDEIISAYHNSKKDSVTIIFSMKKELIVELSQMFPNPLPNNKKWDDYQNEIGRFLFRLNTKSPRYVFELMRDRKFSVKFRGLNSKDAILKIKQIQKKSVIKIKKVEFEHNFKSKIIIKTNIGNITLFFNKPPELGGEIFQNKTKNIFLENKEENQSGKTDSGKINLPENEKSKVRNNGQDTDLTEFEQYLAEHKNDKIYNHILNNRIGNIRDFVEENFRIKENISFDENKIIVKRKQYKNFSADLIFKFEKDEDGYYLFPDYQYEIEKNNIILDKEKIPFFQISRDEITKIIPAISEMILLHRAIGTKVFNFLIHHDQANTLLIVNGKNRKIFEFQNYATLLLLLNQYWENRVVYYKILNVKKVNNNIEIESSLISQNQIISDFANIKILLNSNFKVDLIQVSIFPEIKK